MDAYNLLKPDGSATEIWGCSKCGNIFGQRGLSGEDGANQCCVPWLCATCGKECYPYHKLCQYCVENSQMEKAEKLTEWDGWIYIDGYGHRDGYFETIGDLIEWLEDHEDVPWPEYAFVCAPQAFPAVDIADILEQIECNSFEEAIEHLDGTDELEKAIKVFNEANAGLISYMVDHKRAVKIPARESEAA